MNALVRVPPVILKQLLLCGVEVLLGGLFYLYIDEVQEYVDTDLTNGQQRNSEHDRKAWNLIRNQKNCCLKTDNQMVTFLICFPNFYHFSKRSKFRRILLQRILCLPFF